MMSQPGHGGGVDQAARELGVDRQQILDFSASINPLGLSDSVRKALLESLERVTDYPEVDARSLRSALSSYHRLAEDHLLPGSGSTELIYLLPRVFRPRRALIVEPAFSEYALALQQVDCEIDRLALDSEDAFHLNPQQVLDALKPGTDMVWLANPGNPSGITTEPELLRQLASLLGDCRLVIDEAFIDFCPERSLLKAVTRFDNLFVLRSLTKFYAIPGLRVGYMAGPAEELKCLAEEKQPWTLSGPAIAAAKACLDDFSSRQNSLEIIPRLRAALVGGLEELNFKVYPSQANYLLLRIPEGKANADILCQRLKRQGILLRNCANFSSLDNNYLRVAVRSEDENRKLLSALKEELCDV